MGACGLIQPTECDISRRSYPWALLAIEPGAKDAVALPATLDAVRFAAEDAGIKDVPEPEGEHGPQANRRE